MDKELLFVTVVFWLTCTTYVLYYFNKHYRVNFETVCFAILLGPIIALIMKDPAEEELRDQVRSFDIPDFRHTTEPPPPKKQDKLKEFKFFQSDKDRR
jgi:hypothetical protein